MDWNNILLTLPWILLGYLVGSINFAIVFSKIFYKEDIREKGSKNAGSTNIRRVYGKLIAVITCACDVIKVLLVALIVYLIKIFVPFFKDIYITPIGIFVVIGHVLPIYFKFKGGKGLACLASYFALLQWWLFPICAFIFVLIVKKTRYVSLASLITPFVWIILAIIFGLIFDFTNVERVWEIPITNEPWWVNIIYMIITHLIVVLAHIGNIRRLLNKTERKISKSSSNIDHSKMVIND